MVVGLFTSSEEELLLLEEASGMVGVYVFSFQTQRSLKTYKLLSEFVGISLTHHGILICESFYNLPA
jgi:hypothetical protein